MARTNRFAGDVTKDRWGQPIRIFSTFLSSARKTDRDKVAGDNEPVKQNVPPS
jgi:hypothetical protein